MVKEMYIIFIFVLKVNTLFYVIWLCYITYFSEEVQEALDSDLSETENDSSFCSPSGELHFLLSNTIALHGG